MPAVSKKQQRFFGMVRAAQKTGKASSLEVAKVAATIKRKDAKDIASTKHKGLPMKKEESLVEETPAERIDRISKANVAKQKADSDAKAAKRKASTDAFKKHKASVLSKGGRPVDALDSWQKKKIEKRKLNKEGKSYIDFMSEGNPTSRMLHKSKTQVTGNISADRGSDEKKNREKRRALEKDLKKKGIGHKKGVGEYKYSDGKTGREVSYQTSKPDKMSKRRFGKVMRRLGRKHGQESVITKDKNKPAKLHDTESKKPGKSISLGKSKAGKHKSGDGETSGTKVRSGKLPKKTNKPSYHYNK